LGCGAIGRFVLEAVAAGMAGDARVVVIGGRASSDARAIAAHHSVPYVAPEMLPDYDLRAIVEAAGHEALRAYGPSYLRRGVDVIALSAGALADEAVRAGLAEAARAGRARVFVPSGAIAGLDGVGALTLGGQGRVSITTSKPPAAWTGIEYVDRLGVDVDGLDAPAVLYEGDARRAVALFPQNVNVAAALSLAGIGFDLTRVRVVADPGLSRNTHEIEVEGDRGHLRLRIEGVPTPSNPKTGYLACLSAVAALRKLSNPLWIGV
jgi:aspartate dehydrogenase